MKVAHCDVLVIGGGPGGLAAAKGASNNGAKSVILLERNSELGGILNQCIHDGFGLIRYRSALTGPEYADRAIREAKQENVQILTGRHVSGMAGDHFIHAYTSNGIEKYDAKAIVLATGCREKTRGNISIPGGRPAGIFTAGVAQNLINRRNIMIGKNVVILGSGDIGLIMARRLTLEGANVLAVVEIMNKPCGLSRNVQQCLYEFDIPIYTKTTVSKIIGKKKIEAVELSIVDENRKAVPGTERRIECNALVLSVGLIPENEIAQTMHVVLNQNNEIETDEFLQTNIAGIFSCGNSRKVMDLADYVSEQGEMAGRNAVHYIRNENMEKWNEEKTNCMKKGFPEKNTITCTVCPNGCQIYWDAGKKIYVGNKCSRGIKYAEQERTNPLRTITTTVRVSCGNKVLCAVKSGMQVKQKDVIEIVKNISHKTIENEWKIGEELFRVSYGEEISIPIVSTMSY